MKQEPLFSISSLGKRFGHTRILEDISFEIYPGDFLLLLGNNGAGKSTLLKIMSSLMWPSKGELLFQGMAYGSCGNLLRSSIGVISHESQFYGDLTARENLRVFGSLYNAPDLKNKVIEALKELRLDGFPDVPVRAFSSGMLKRLAFARLALYRPEVLLLDEPYSGLDRDSIKLLDEFLERFKGGGGTTVMVTHQFTSGVAFCNRILILNRGGLVYNQQVEGINGEKCAALLDQYSQARSAAPVERPRTKE